MYSQSSENSAGSQGPSSCNEPEFTDHYEVLRDIGRGMFGEVKLARHRLTGAEVAVKVVPKVLENLPVRSEPFMLRGLDHPNVIQLFQVIGTVKNLYMVLEHAGGGQLLELITRGGMQEKEAWIIFMQMVCAVGYCHDKGIVHRDLKPENILVDARGTVKLIDFGLSTRFTPGQKLNNFWGTLAYLAPELVQREPYEGPPVDIWCLGVILYFMLAGRHPFMAKTAEGLMVRIMMASYHVPHSVPAQARKLIHKVLVVEPNKRPTVQQILRHPWLRKGKKHLPHPTEALPKHPDPAILTILFDMGYDPYQFWVSLTKRKFDAAMATYLILQQQKSQGAGCLLQGKALPPRVGPRPSPDLPKSPVLPKRSSSEPALRTFPLPCEKAKNSGQKDSRRASLPAIPLRFLSATTPTPCGASQSDPVPHVSRPWRFHAGRVMPTDSSASRDTPPGPPPDSRRGWRKVTQRIASCFRRLCCSAPHVTNKVAPM